jgi:hypothetical protein
MNINHGWVNPQFDTEECVAANLAHPRESKTIEASAIVSGVAVKASAVDLEALVVVSTRWVTIRWAARVETGSFPRLQAHEAELMAAVTACHMDARLAKLKPMAAGWALLDAAVKRVLRHPVQLCACILTLLLVVFPLVLASDASLCTARTWRNGRPGAVLELLDWDELAAIVVGAVHPDNAGCVVLLCFGLVRGDNLRGQDMLNSSREQRGAALCGKSFNVVERGVVGVNNTGGA